MFNYLWDKLAGFVSELFGKFDIITALFVFLSVTAIILFLIFSYNYLSYFSRKRRYTVLKGRRRLVPRLVRILKSYRLSSGLLHNISIKIGMFNNSSYEKNIENSALLCIGGIFFCIVSMAVFLPSARAVWYVSLSYLVIALVFVLIVFVILSFMARIRFTSKLPDTFKLINSRYITEGNIQKAVNASMEDFDKAVRREMMKIQNVLKKNNMQEIDETFKRIETTYRNEYLTLLLNLIKQAYYKGGDQQIKKQFEATTEEILTDIENQRDLSFTSRIYMLLTILLPFGLKWLESFNHNALGDKAAAFYSSPLGIEIKIIFYFFFLLYLGILLFLERTA